MREIKFRVWDTMNEKYVKSNCGIFLLSQDNKLYFQDTKNGGELEYIKDPNYIIEQFTGLYEKNGKEIYEGDIVEVYGSVGEVVFSRGSWAFKEQYRLYTLYNYRSEEMQVIGNIHEANNGR